MLGRTDRRLRLIGLLVGFVVVAMLLTARLGYWQVVRGADLGVLPLPGSATGLETSPGRITYYLTDVRGGMVAVRAGEWPVPLGGDPGDGRHAAVTTTLDGYPCTVLAHRGAKGRVLLGVCVAEDERNGVWWTDTGTHCLGDPVLALDGRGRVAVLALATDGSLTEREVIRHCAAQLEEFMVPASVEFRGELPKSDNGKISRRELAAQAA